MCITHAYVCPPSPTNVLPHILMCVCLSTQESQIKRIFGTLINQKLQDFEEELKPIGNTVTDATIEMYNAITARFLPTPTKIHYLFNLRDISRVIVNI